MLAAAGKGRSVVAARDMQAGQLLFVENPLAIAHVDSNQLGFQIDMQSRRMVRLFAPDMHSCVLMCSCFVCATATVWHLVQSLCVRAIAGTKYAAFKLSKDCAISVHQYFVCMKLANCPNTNQHAKTAACTSKPIPVQHAADIRHAKSATGKHICCCRLRLLSLT